MSYATLVAVLIGAPLALYIGARIVSAAIYQSKLNYEQQRGRSNGTQPYAGS